jgi:hypothetical protein
VVVLVYGGVRLDLLLLLLLLLLVPLLFLALPPGLLVDLLHRSQLLLQLHPPVLEPDLDLALGQTECVGDLDAPPPGQVVIEVELFLQLQRLEPGVGLPAPSPRAPVRTIVLTTDHSVKGAHPVCDGHPGVPGDVRDGLSPGSGGLGAGVERVDDGAGRLVVELRGDGHGGGGGADRACCGDGGAVLVVVSERVVDHGVGRGHVGGETGRVPARLVGGGVDGRGERGGARRRRKRGDHAAGRGAESDGGRRLLLVVVVGGGGRHVRIHPGGGGGRRRAAAGMLGRGAARRGRAAGGEAGVEGGGGGGALEQLLVVELLVVLREHAINYEFGTHRFQAGSRPLHRALLILRRLHRTRFTTAHLNLLTGEFLTRPSPLLLRILYDPCMFSL